MDGFSYVIDGQELLRACGIVEREAAGADLRLWACADLHWMCAGELSGPLLEITTAGLAQLGASHDLKVADGARRVVRLQF